MRHRVEDLVRGRADGDLVVIGEDGAALDHVEELTHVIGSGIGAECGERDGREGFAGPGVECCQLAEEALDAGKDAEPVPKSSDSSRCAGTALQHLTLPPPLLLGGGGSRRRLVVTPAG
jgi:hypothetical protein